MIEISDLTKRYGAATVVDHVSLTIERGGVTAIVGPNGAGKSTLLSIVGRLLAPDEGTVLVDGLDVAGVKSDLLARRLAILRQDHRVPVRLTVRELVSFGRFPHRDATNGDHEAHVDRAIESLGLAPLQRRRLEELSGGQRQRAFIATVLCQDTDYVLLDEPLNSLDMRHAIDTMRIVRSLADDLAKTVVIVLHDVNVAAAQADRIVAMRGGCVVADGTPGVIVRPHVLDDVFGVHVDVRVIDGRPVALHFAPVASPGIPPRSDAPSSDRPSSHPPGTEDP